MIAWENTLWGTMQYGGDNGEGAIFKINTDGSGLVVLHHFSRYETGGHPLSELLAVGSVVYGTTQEGGENDAGTIFTLPIPEPTTVGQIAALAISTLAALTIRRRMVHLCQRSDKVV